MRHIHTLGDGLPSGMLCLEGSDETRDSTDCVLRDDVPPCHLRLCV